MRQMNTSSYISEVPKVLFVNCGSLVGTNHIEHIWRSLRRIVHMSDTHTIEFLQKYIDEYMYKQDGRSVFDLIVVDDI